ncbi:AMP-binding protein [Streptomyces sp. A7024]|uniref:AMP-binding protein n=1 Tax=Streptomyces coryli TaxID=1128680 RepID=A0A6G4U0N1_9ACTN|nr:AMP-binding protein [Streptomyces coryli]NGN65552.1 AMP-binding protein [Streptomyces coryli]
MRPDAAAVPRLIHHAVTRQARLHPDSCAVIDGPLRVSYDTLDRAADAYAADLAAAGVRAGDLVPVALPRGARLIVALLAVLKCGAGYATLDVARPAGQLRRSVEQLGARVGIGRPLAEHAAAVWCPPEEPLAETAAGASQPIEADVDEHAVAAVFFTSGTTGAPKAVASPHRAAMRLFVPAPLPGYGPGRTMVQAAPVGWDAFTLEVWGPLITGGTCAIAGGGGLLPDELRELIDEAGARTLWLTSALFNLFVDEDLDAFTGLETVYTGGEVLSPGHVRSFLDRHPGIALFNGYGPVESCGFATTHRIRPADCDNPAGIPIGSPVPGTGVHLADGEIYLTGAGLATGYLNNPAENAARFTTLATAAGAERAYRTGDRAEVDADGVWHFRGRTDRQVKIAGHRVEPAGIEAVARTAPGVRHCAAVPVPGPGGAPDRLALFYTAAATAAESTPAALRGHLQQQLPRPWVPAVLHPLPALPTTANGKVDHAALLALLRATPARSTS